MSRIPKPPTKSPAASTRLLTVADVAELDQCSEKTVRRAIEKGLLQASRVGPGGRLLRIDPTALEAYRRRHDAYQRAYQER